MAACERDRASVERAEKAEAQNKILEITLSDDRQILDELRRIEAENARLKDELKKAREFRAAFEKLLPILRKFPEFEKCYQAAIAPAAAEEEEPEHD
jgi:hypothetical protein